MTALVSDLIRQLSGLYATWDRQTPEQRLAAFWWGAQDDEVAWALALANRVQDEPIAERLYLAHVAEDMRHAREVKEWAYMAAVDFANATTKRERARRNVEGYQPAWGHQAARDGLALALWPHLSDDVPGIGKRCEQYGCGKQGFQRIRDEVQRQTSDLIVGYALDFEQALERRFSRDFMARWESATGAKWDEQAA